MPKTAGYMTRMLHLDDEREDGGSIIVSLKDGWRFSSDPLCPVHVEGFNTMREAKAGIKNAIKCECDDCAK